jgi:hypothetical protein
LKNPLFGFLWFIAISAVLYAVWALNDGKLGSWAFVIALAVASIPMLVSWLLKAKRDPN